MKTEKEIMIEQIHAEENRDRSRNAFIDAYFESLRESAAKDDSNPALKEKALAWKEKVEISNPKNMEVVK